jgi:methionyl-tRNA formyltransferase
MKITFFGSAQFGIASLQAIKDSAHTLTTVFTQPAQPAGRGRKLTPTPVAEWAEKNSIPCIETANINTPEMAEIVSTCRGDLLLVIAFGQKIANHVIKLHQKGAINVHASLLPKYRGAAPINYAIMNGETETGITIITLAERMDAGKILAHAKTPITPDDCAQTLHDKLASISPPLLIETIGKIDSGKAIYTPQDESAATFAPKLTKSDGYINWTTPAASIVNQIRGLWPRPGAQADFVSAKTQKCCRVTFAAASAAQCTDDNKTQFGILDHNLNVISADGAVTIHKLKPAGRALMNFKDFVNGRKVQPGDMFLPIDKTGRKNSC